MIDSMPNLKTLVINPSLFPFPIEALKQLSKCLLQKFCLDVYVFPSSEHSKHNSDLIKTLFNYCGSSLDLVKISVSLETTLSTSDLFYENEYDDSCTGLRKEVKRIVSWIKENIKLYPKLQYFTFYNYSFVIDRLVEPCQWIQINGRKL